MFSLAECSTSPGSGWVVVYVTGWCDQCVVYCALTPLTTDNTHLIFSVGVKHNCSWPRSQARPPLHWQANSLVLLLFTVFLSSWFNPEFVCFTFHLTVTVALGAADWLPLYSLFWFLVKMIQVTTGQRCPGSLGCPQQTRTRSWSVDCTCELWVVVLHVSVDTISTI